MTIGFLTNIISPHQLPLARELVNLVGEENYLYVHTDAFHSERAKLGWSQDVTDVKHANYDEASRQWLLNADLVYLELRDFDLIEERLKSGKPTFYVCERWFKPVVGSWWLVAGGWRSGVCRWIDSWVGRVRMLVPGYRKMARRLLSASKSPKFRCLSQGPWAKKDFLWLGIPPEKIVDWGYFVAPSTGHRPSGTSRQPLKLLWAGRMLGLKRVSDIVRAVGCVVKKGHAVTLTLVGNGPERARLEHQVRQLHCDDAVTLRDSVPINEVRELMRAHGCYVFSSNAYEGWGAVVSEALEEGMDVLGTWECGACPALLPRERLYHAGDWKSLAKLIERECRGELPQCSVGEWTAKAAARRMLKVCETC